MVRDRSSRPSKAHERHPGFQDMDGSRLRFKPRPFDDEPPTPVLAKGVRERFDAAEVDVFGASTSQPAQIRRLGGGTVGEGGRA